MNKFFTSASCEIGAHIEFAGISWRLDRLESSKSASSSPTFGRPRQRTKTVALRFKVLAAIFADASS